MLDLVCLGNVTIDDVVLPDGLTQMGCFGGDAIYAALGASMWSEYVQFVAPIGNDYPVEHLKRLELAGWDLIGMPVRNVPTYRNLVIYENDGHRTWVQRTNPADFFILSPLVDDIPVAYLNARAFLILAMDLAAQENLVAGLKDTGALLALDPQEDYIPGNEQRILRMLASVDVFLPSEIEVERILGHRNYKKAACQFANSGCKIVVIKQGAMGSLLYDAVNDVFQTIPIYKTETIDTTGAGDTYSGGFMAKYVTTGNTQQAGIAGAVSASFAVEGFGLTHLFDISREKAQIRFDELMVQFSVG